MRAAKKAPSKQDFGPVFDALKEILTPYEGQLKAVHDKPEYYYLETFEPTYKNRPMFFAAVKGGKSYVSYHLLPLYMDPQLVKTISPELKKRMQGKACFNFISIDKPLFKELGELTKAGYRRFKELKYL
jgi:hypothetical protein